MAVPSLCSTRLLGVCRRMHDKKALVLFSGGQDSATCLVWALRRFSTVETIGFEYGQRHQIELDARQRVLRELRKQSPEWREKLGRDDVLSLDIFRHIGGNALTVTIEIKAGSSGLPNTFVPGRNVLFLTAAAALAYGRGIRDLVIGVCETDYSGYPDCREETIKAVQHAISLGMDTAFTVHTPLMFLDKAATWSLAEQVGGKFLVDLIREQTVTCYKGDRDHRHDWGYGCGECPACVLRAKGYRRYVGQ